ncbi:MAG TPA: beta-galactosidase [Lacunisphaera sp.]|nr:beta-galactosidase [Lacunisphaera sp.]
MKSLFQVALCALLFASPRVHAAAPEPDGKPHKFEYGERVFLLDGQPMLIAAGEMHFGRVLPQDWETRIKQAKAMGLNTLSFYLFWNLCEPQEGKFTFTGLTDVRRMLKLCQENGLWAILRPGPYCCAEVEYGGIPWWTAKYPEVKVRSTDPRWLAWSRRYVAQVARQVADLQVTRGGPLLMVQMENEFGMVSGGNFAHLKVLQRIFTESGFEIPLFTCDPFLRPPPSPDTHPAGVLRGRNGLRTDRDLEQTIAAIGNSPVFVPELYTAWFSGWGQPIATRNASVEQAVTWTTYLLEKKVSFCYYMFHGGTTYGFFNGTNEYLPVQTSYDYSAPVDEAGRTTPKYHALRPLLASRLGVAPPPVPAEPAVVTLPPIHLAPAQALLETLPRRGRQSEAPLAMESLDQAYGAVVYRKRFPHGLKGTLELRDALDYAIVLVNGRDVGRIFRGYGIDQNKVELNESGPVTLDIFVYNLGRISVIVSERTQSRARKGLIGGAWLDGVALTDWENFSLPLEKLPRFKPSSRPHLGPKFYFGSFQVDAPAGTFLDLRPWHFGIVWVNGHNLGRYWDRGALRSLFLPAAFQKKGRNEIVVLELHDAPEAAEIASATAIIEEKPVPFDVALDRPPPRPRPAATPTAP